MHLNLAVLHVSDLSVVSFAPFLFVLMVQLSFMSVVGRIVLQACAYAYLEPIVCCRQQQKTSLQGIRGGC